MKRVYSSIDFGSSSIKLVVCELYKGKLNLLAVSKVPSKGIKRGLITDPISAKNCINMAFKKAEGMLGFKIDKVIATLPSYFAEYTLIKGKASVKGEVITSEDINNAYENGIRSKINPNEEFVTILPIDFKINDRSLIKTPSGFPGDKIFSRAIMATAPKKNVYSVITVLESLGIEVTDVTLSPIADIFMFKSKEIASLVGIGINIGAETTTVTLYNRALPVKNTVIQIGGTDIDYKISEYYGISLKNAKKLKEVYALAHTRNSSKTDYMEVVNNQGVNIRIRQAEVSQLVMEKLFEIFSLVKKDINLLTNREIQYIILSGGTSEIKDLEYLLKEVLPNPFKIGKIRTVGVRSNEYSVALGSILSFVDTLKTEGKDYSMLSESNMESLSSPDENSTISGDSMLGKVFGYFFGE